MDYVRAERKLLLGVFDPVLDTTVGGDRRPAGQSLFMDV